MEKLTKIAVFCGSSMGSSEVYRKGAEALGRAMAERGIGLVYGGGNRGIMGTIAHTVYDLGCPVIGVLPKAMDIPSVTEDTASTEVVLADNMHERKRIMYDLAQAFIAMPGGIGTIEELAEIYTWRQLDYHRKNIALFNVNGYWDPLLKQLETSVKEGFLAPEVFHALIVSSDPEELLDRLEKEKTELPFKLK